MAAGVSGLMGRGHRKVPVSQRIYALHLVSLGVPKAAVARRYGVSYSGIESWLRTASRSKYSWCRICDNWFAQNSGGRRKYCDSVCTRLASRERTSEHRAGKVNLLCRWCLVTPKAYHRQHCSDDCARQSSNHLLAHGSDLWCLLPLCCECGLVKGINHAAGLCRGCLVGYNRRANARARIRGKGRMREAAYRDGDPITREGVIARVGRRCHLCNKLARLDVGHLHPLAAEVDHLIPISKGGGNVWDNVAIAHRACNVKKGNKAAGDQLRLLTVGGV